MYHEIIIIGHLGGDTEMKYLPNGKAVVTMSVASNRKYTASNGERVEETIWWRVSVWGRQAEACHQYLRKGSKVLVTGQMRPDPATGGPRIWTRQDGTPGASFEVTASQVRFLSGKQDAEPVALPASDDEMPF